MSTKRVVMVSYSHKDKRYVQALAAAFADTHVEIRYDRLVILTGDDWFAKILEEIKAADHLLLLLSPSSLASEFVDLEVKFAALHGEIQRKSAFILCVLIKECPVPDWLKPYDYVDMPNNPIEGIKRLLRRLGFDDS